MVGTINKTEATTVAPENTNEEAASVGILKNLTKEQLADREKVNTLNNTIEKAGKQFLLNRFALAFLLIVLRKKYKELFWTVIDTSNVSQKTLERAMLLVLKDESVFSQAMSNDGGEKDITENVELLVPDERVKDLDMEALSKINKPTLVKIANMKKLSDTDWKIVIGGSDKPFKEHMKAQAKKVALEKVEADRLKAEQIVANKPATMDINKYLNYTQKDKLFSIKRIAELEDILSKNGLLPKEDSKPSYIPTELKLSAVSKSESEEA